MQISKKLTQIKYSFLRTLANDKHNYRISRIDIDRVFQGDNSDPSYCQVSFKKWLLVNVVAFPAEYIHTKTFGYLQKKVNEYYGAPIVYLKKMKPVFDNINYIFSIRHKDSFCVLLHGEPGTGKSYWAYAFKKYVQDKFGKGVEIRFEELDNYEFASSKNSNYQSPRRPINIGSDEDSDFRIYVLDELDLQINGDKQLEGKARTLIDKLKKEKCLILITTNSIEALSPEVKRDGRIDLEIETTGFDVEEASEYLGMFGIKTTPPSLHPGKLYKYAKEENRKLYEASKR